MQRQKGFTLIELLVVISIIALLVGILLPALGAARKTAINIKCLSNHRQIAIGLMSYQNDKKDRFPDKTVLQFSDAGQYLGRLDANTRSWIGSTAKDPSAGGALKRIGAVTRPLNAYVGGPYEEEDDEVPAAVCPADEQQDESSLFFTWGTSYRANIGAGLVLTVNNDSANFQPGRLATEVTSPSKTVAMFESVALEVADPKNTSINSSNPNYDRMFWHSSLGEARFNTSFCDGHAATLTFEEGAYVTDTYTFNYNDFPRRPEPSEYE